MKIAIYTLTRDRLEFTKHCFGTLWSKAGESFDHYIIDNGSTDGTPQWLGTNGQQFKSVTYLSKNVGISVGSNLALAQIAAVGGYDLVIKMDNDCEVVTDEILKRIVKCFEELGKYPAVLSPRVEGIVHQPVRVCIFKGITDKIKGSFLIGATGIVGGLFHIVPWSIYKDYRYPETLPLAWGQDDDFCEWLRRRGVLTGYIEELVVKHYLTTDGQVKKYPDYFKRKKIEEK